MPVSSLVTAAMEPVLLCLWTLGAAHLNLQATITEWAKKRLGSEAITSNEWSTMDKLAQLGKLRPFSVVFHIHFFFSPWTDSSSAHVWRHSNPRTRWPSPSPRPGSGCRRTRRMCWRPAGSGTLLYPPASRSQHPSPPRRLSERENNTSPDIIVLLLIH